MGISVLVNSDDIACAQVDGSHRAIMERAGVTLSSRLALRVLRSLVGYCFDVPPSLSAGDCSDRFLVWLGSPSTSELSPPKGPKSSPAPSLSPWFESCSGVWSSGFLPFLVSGVVFLQVSGVPVLDPFSDLGLGLVSGVDLALESFGDMPRGDALFLVGMGTGFCKDSATFLSADVTRLYVRGLFSLFPVPPCCL